MASVPDAIQSVRLKRSTLLRVLGVSFGLAVAIGNTIGSGILRAPGEIAANLPNVWLFLGVWLAGGIYALLGAISIAELGTMIPQSGGQYAFARRALGNFAGFVVGWSDWISTCGSTAAVALVIGEYSDSLSPYLVGHTKLIAIVVTIVFALLQWRGIQWGNGTQQLTTLLKALAFIALIAACFILGNGGEFVSGSEPALPVSQTLFLALVLSLQRVIYTYDGWTGVIYFSEEIREPARDIPRALFGSVFSVIGIYMLVNLGLIYVLPLSKLAGQELAAGTVATTIFGAYGDPVIRALTIVSMLSSINAFHLMASRVLFSMGRDRLFSTRAVKVNAGGTPTVALLLSTIVSLLFVSFDTFQKVTAVLAFFFVASYAISFTSLFVLRRREPDTPRPYRALGYPWTTGLALLGSVAFLVGSVASDTRNSITALLLLAASYPAFLIMRKLTPAKDQDGNTRF